MVMHRMACDGGSRVVGWVRLPPSPAEFAVSAGGCLCLCRERVGAAWRGARPAGRGVALAGEVGGCLGERCGGG